MKSECKGCYFVQYLDRRWTWANREREDTKRTKESSHKKNSNYRLETEKSIISIIWSLAPICPLHWVVIVKYGFQPKGDFEEVLSSFRVYITFLSCISAFSKCSLTVSLNTKCMQSYRYKPRKTAIRISMKCSISLEWECGTKLSWDELQNQTISLPWPVLRSNLLKIVTILT